MNEIEKLYENAEVKKQIPKVCSSNELYCKECKAHIEDAMSYCKNASYPPFTAEKQIELIKWLANSRKGILISDMGEGDEGEFNISTGFYYCAKHIQNFRKNKDLSVVIAEFINNLWQDLTEEEKEEIKEMLE